MNKVAIAPVKKELQTKVQPENFTWLDNPHIQKLLDVAASIIADEYIQIAKQNPEVFRNENIDKILR